MTSRPIVPRWIAPLMVFVILFAFALFLQSVSFLPSKQADAAPVAALPLAPPTDCPTELFFSEYIEGSSYNKALEIYNGTGGDMTFAGNYRVRFYFNGHPTAESTITLSGTLANRDVYVIANSSAAQAILEQAHLTSSVNFFNGDDAVALFKDGQIIDVIGQIGFDPGSEWGTGNTSTKDNTIVRKSAVTTGDSDGSDAFEPSLEWDGYSQNTFSFLGSHTQHCGDDGTPELTISKDGPAFAQPGESITYTLLVNNIGSADAADLIITDTLPAAATFVTYSSSTPLTFTNNAPILVWEAGTMSSNTALTISLNVELSTFSHTIINTAQVTSTSPGDEPENNSDTAVTTLSTGGACGDAFTAIGSIQGDGDASPLPDGTPITTQGVVVGDFQNEDQLNGFFLQDATGDGDPATSDGIFVYDPSGTDVAVGDVVRLTGEVQEYFSLTEITNVSKVLNCGTGSVTAATLNLPVDELADFEQYEGMLINIPQELHVTELWQLGRYGQITLSEGGRLPQPTNVITPGLDANLLAEANNKRRIILDDGSTQQNPDPLTHPSPGLSASNTLRGGDRLPNLTGILNYRANEFRVEPIDVIPFTHANSRPSLPADVAGRLKVASFNVLNYFNGDGMGGGFPTSRGADTPTEFIRQRDKIIAATLAMDADIIGLMELENDGYDQYSAIQDLVDGLNSAASGTYAFIDPGVEQIGDDQIAVGLIYNLTTVTPVGDAAILDSSVDPMFNDDKNRPALAQTFEENTTGERLTIVVNHLKSKGSDCDEVGDPDLGDGQGNCNVTRTNAAIAAANWLATDPTGSGDADFLIMGDLNAYAMEDPINALKEAGYTNLIEAFLGQNAYSYVFDGQWGYLDHVLANQSLTPQVTGVTEWHINADEPNVLDYNEEFKTAAQLISLYNDDQYRASDHDPVIVGLNLGTRPDATFSQDDYTVDEDASTATISVTLSTAVEVTTTVDYSTMDGSATASDDYLATSGTLTFTASSTSATFTVNILDDNEFEEDETVILQLSSPMPFTLNASDIMTTTLTILDNDDSRQIYLPIVRNDD